MQTIHGAYTRSSIIARLINIKAVVAFWALFTAWLSYILLTSITYMFFLLVSGSTLYYNHYSRCHIICVWNIFGPLQNCWEFEPLNFLGHSNCKIHLNHVFWFRMILSVLQFWILHYSSFSCFCSFQWPPFVTIKKPTKIHQMTFSFFIL